MPDGINSAKPKFTRGNQPPPARGTLRLSVVRTDPDFSVREDETTPPPPPRPRYQRGDRLPPPPTGLVKAGDAEPFIRPLTKFELMTGARPGARRVD
jgi:hypothetical protein